MKHLPISERFYDWPGQQGRLHVIVYKPERAPSGHGFRCYFRLSNFPPGGKRLLFAWGIDSLQAIQQAIQGVRESLRPYEDSLGFLGMMHLSLPRPLPGGLGPELDQHFEELMRRAHAQLHKELHESNPRHPRSRYRRQTGSQSKIIDTLTPRSAQCEEPIAERVFDWLNGRGQVRAILFTPERDPGSDDFRCRFNLSGLPRGSQKTEECWGIDTLQALYMAIQGVRATLEPFRQQLRWNGSYWLGLSQFITDGFGPGIDRHFERLVDMELERLARNE